MSSEVPRQLVHIGVGAIAVSLRWLSWTEAAALAATAILFNRFVLPRLSASVFRDGDLDRPWRSGILLYPIAVLGLVLISRQRLDLAAAAWGILAAGDGVATLAGKGLRSPPLPWNPDKTWAGLAGFAGAATLAAVGLLSLVGRVPIDAALVAMAAIAAVTAALVETIPIRLDDNLSVPFAALAALWSVDQFEPAIAAARAAEGNPGMAAAAAVNVIVAALGLAAGTVTRAGAVTGAAIGTAIAIGGGWAAWGLLMLTFLAASACTRLGAARKAAAGIAEAKEGRRGPGNALANTGLAAWMCALALGLADPGWAMLACAAALVTAGSDTVASEIGKAYGRTTWLVTSFRRVPRGTTGAVSVEGTLAGVTAAAGLAAAGAWWGLVPWTAVPVITGAATIASLVEGAIGATLEARGILNNDMVNFVNSAMGAGLTLAIWSVVS